MNLYAINYNYKKSYSIKVENDTWYVGAESSDEIVKLMLVNKSGFIDSGLELLNYSFRKVSVTDNYYNVILEKK